MSTRGAIVAAGPHPVRAEGTVGEAYQAVINLKVHIAASNQLQ
jgi:hypothetical protein